MLCHGRHTQCPFAEIRKDVVLSLINRFKISLSQSQFHSPEKVLKPFDFISFSNHCYTDWIYANRTSLKLLLRCGGSENNRHFFMCYIFSIFSITSWIVRPSKKCLWASLNGNVKYFSSHLTSKMLLYRAEWQDFKVWFDLPAVKCGGDDNRLQRNSPIIKSIKSMITVTFLWWEKFLTIAQALKLT